jgi:hypothetical protein
MRVPQVDEPGNQVTVRRVEAPDWFDMCIRPRQRGGGEVRVNRRRVTEREASALEQLLNRPPGQDNQP